MIYLFKCAVCNKDIEYEMSLSKAVAMGTSDVVCKCKKGHDVLYGSLQINFKGQINMNSSAIGVAKRKYSNKSGGPRPIISGKVRNDIKAKI